MQQLSIIAGSMAGIILLLLFVQARWTRHRALRAVAIGRRGLSLSSATPPIKETAGTTLPPPVQRYLLSVLPEEPPNIRFVTVEQSGRMRVKENAPWRRMEASSYYVTDKPALVWDARISVYAGLWKTAQLMYVNEEGLGSVKLLGGISMMESAGDEADISLLFRFLAEAVWYPTLFRHESLIQWTAVDDKKAEALIRDGELHASATFHFSEDNEIAKIVTEDKYRDYKGSFTKERFTMHCAGYRLINAVKIPTEVSFQWNRPDGDFTYAEIKVNDVVYE